MNSATNIFESLRGEMREMFGTLIDLPPVKAGNDGFTVIRSLFPKGAVVPLHSHADHEVLVVISGSLGVWLDGSWKTYESGALIDIRPDKKHALRNDGNEDVAAILNTTVHMGQFFSEISVPVNQVPLPLPQRLAHFAERAAAYGFWNGDAQDQASIGIHLPG